MLVGSPALQARTGPELIALAKAQPGKLTYGTWGLGSVAHLWGIELQKAAGIQMLHVPFQGTPAVATALMGNQVDLMFMSPSQAVPADKAGKLKIIGSTAAVRAPEWQNVPTLAEQGFAGYEGSTWFGLFAPANTSPAVLDRLNQELNDVLRSPETVAVFAAMAMKPEGGRREDLTSAMESSRERWARVIRENKIELDQ
jgi:tripartite-type tricarboxylate transporter receptor subunit TctC